MHSLERVSSFLILAAITLTASAQQPAPTQQHGGWTIVWAEKSSSCSYGELASVENDSLELVIRACRNSVTGSAKPKVMLEVELDLMNEPDEFRWEPMLVGRAGQRVAAAGIELTLTFDNDKPITERWQGAGGTAIKTFHQNEKLTLSQFLEELRDRDKLTVAYTLATGKHRTATFDLKGTEDLVQALCKEHGCSIM